MPCPSARRATCRRSSCSVKRMSGNSSSDRRRRWVTRVALALPVTGLATAGLLWCMPAATAAPEDSSQDVVPVAAAAAKDPAERATSAPATQSSDENPADRLRRRRQDLLTNPASSFSEADQLASEALMREHAPHMWKRLESLPDSGPFRNRLRRQMLDRGRELVRMQQRDPEQFKREVEQVSLEDEVADLGRQLLGRGEPATDDTETLRKRLRERISQLV